jgi:hypothetical protein
VLLAVEFIERLILKIAVSSCKSGSLDGRTAL